LAARKVPCSPHFVWLLGFIQAGSEERHLSSASRLITRRM